MTVPGLFVILIFVAALFMATTLADVDGGDSERGQTQSDEVQIEIITPPPADCERKSKRYDQVYMHYVGTLTETGKKFDASHDRNQPFDFQLGAGEVIRGWDEGLVDMCVGEKRKLIIPPSKAYGETGAGAVVPPNASLTFEVELVNITDGIPPANIFKEIDTDGDKKLSQEEVSDYLKKQPTTGGNVPEDNDQHKYIITKIFSHEDKDKDGFISHEEFSGPKHDEL